MQLADAFKQLPLIAVLRGITPEEAVDVGQVLINAGFTCMEVPLNSPNPLISIQKLHKNFGTQAIIGAGTVTQVTQVQKIIDHGGKLIVMPHANVEVISAAKNHGLYCIPGFSTPTEAFAAIYAGADALKLFPAEAAPPAVLRAFKAVLPKEIPIFPVGGITPGALASYLAAGANGFGLGSALYKAGDTAKDVAEKAKLFINALKQPY